MLQFKSLPKFLKYFKKFHRGEQEIIRKELKKIQAEPDAGELKKGVLSEIRVHKFKIRAQLYLIAYEHEPQEKTIYLYAIGTHENFYRALERYVN